MKRFEHKVALVTAAGSGIGEATARLLAAEGASVMLADLNADRCEQVARSLTEAGADVRWTHMDATLEADVQRAVEGTISAFGGLSVAANVVGGSSPDAALPEFHVKSVEGWDGTMAISLRSVYLSMKHEIAWMIEHGGGTIANVSSMAAFKYVPEAGAAYSAAKAGVIQLTRFAAATYADRGVRVNCISPGVTLTPAYDGFGEGAAAALERMTAQQPIARTIDPSEQAEAIAWLCSDASAMVTGHLLPIDGGWQAR